MDLDEIEPAKRNSKRKSPDDSSETGEISELPDVKRIKISPSLSEEQHRFSRENVSSSLQLNTRDNQYQNPQSPVYNLDNHSESTSFTSEMHSNSGFGSPISTTQESVSKQNMEENQRYQQINHFLGQVHQESRMYRQNKADKMN